MVERKSALLGHCIALAKAKVISLEEELHSTRESTTSEGKSTAGDKHETTRAMMHLEQEKLHRQLAEAQGLLAELERTDVRETHIKAGLGSIIGTDKGMFFIAAALGRVEFGGATCFVVSAKAPIAAQLIGKTVGEKVKVNGVGYSVLSVE